MLDKLLIEERLRAMGAVLPKIYIYDTTDSTNTRARERAREHTDERECAVFIASGQTAGRGRRGRSFESPLGAGLYVSFLIYPDECGEDATRITAYAAVRLCRAVRAVSGAAPMIKWVNDLYIGDKKLAGILTEGEMDSDGKMGCLVVGMGINVYKNALSADVSQIATSIEEGCGVRICREELAAHIIAEFLSGLSETAHPDTLAEYRRLSLVVGRDITVTPIGKESYSARAIAIQDDYSLLVEKENGENERLFSAEVSTKVI